MSKESLDTLFGQMLDQYPLARYGPRHKQHVIFEIMGAIRQAHEAHVQPLAKDYLVRASTGIGATWANVPWLAVLDPQETDTAQDGRYVTTMFAADGSALVVAICWGTQRLRREHGKEATDLLASRRASTVDTLTEHLDHVFTIGQDVDLAASTPLARDYERSCLTWRRFDTHALPDEATYWSVFDQLMAANQVLIESA
ncbi:DUF3578 domain-containing protein [Persicimonas caeni]|uniref:DUF3578 domain-containing protein n=1 Tax=Persicimonas caeni TaxID=2292766 RepID=A0A4Y6Q0B1_PERCE|nr:DUF3578 domain-containing protein [Persicimonas caeni]QDG53962.1 DUF3578 domain-containing protein [Persicimonas caeni]QED35183.1 DUF3578 domain-containing protein [Persicimonas caeni]